MNNQERVVLVNEDDQAIGLEEKLLAHQKGLLHRAFSIFIFRKNGGELELLLQQRQHHKYHCRGLWTNTCCSHPREGEVLLEAAHRRLQEEMGFSVDLTHAGHFIYRAELPEGLIEHELDHVFCGWFGEESVHFNAEEVAAVEWVSIETLRHDLNAHPKKYTPWLGQALSLALVGAQH